MLGQTFFVVMVDAVYELDNLIWPQRFEEMGVATGIIPGTRTWWVVYHGALPRAV